LGKAAGLQTIPNDPRPIAYRAATSADHDAIAQVWLASWLDTPVAEQLTESSPTLESLRERLDDEAGAKWDLTVALCGTEIVGFLAVDGGASILDQLFIAPDAQGRGIGSALLKQAMTKMPGGFTLRTAAINKATRFYDRAGLQRIKMMVHPGMGHRLMQFRWNGASA
jgi:GNAT superfamily N-acetyltransferase